MMTKNKVAAALLIFLNCCYIFFYLRLWYQYEFTNILFMVMLPTWKIILNLIVGIAGIFMGIKVFESTISIIKGFSISLALILFSELLSFIINL